MCQSYILPALKKGSRNLLQNFGVQLTSGSSPSHSGASISIYRQRSPRAKTKLPFITSAAVITTVSLGIIQERREGRRPNETALNRMY